MKKCAKCHTPKPLDDFGHQKDTKDGGRAYCKPCDAQYLKDWKARQPKKPKLFIVKPPHQPNVVCLACGTKFYCPKYYLKRGGGKYCSPDCYHNRESIRQKMPCIQCGTIFYFSPYEAEDDRRFCSRQCGDTFRSEQARNRTTKQCYRCGIMKIIDQFHHNKSNVDGHSNLCISCKNSEATTPETQKRKKKYRKEHPEKGYLYCSQRRARLLGAPYEDITLDEIYLRDGGRCQICHGKTLPPHKGKRTDPKKATIDHIIPVSHPDFPTVGHIRTNVRLAHLGCNSSRRNKPGDAQYLLFG